MTTQLRISGAPTLLRTPHVFKCPQAKLCRLPPLRARQENAPQASRATEQEGQPAAQQELECTLSGMDNVECEYVDPSQNPDRRPSTVQQQEQQQGAPDLVQVAGPFGLLILVSPFMFWVGLSRPHCILRC